MARIFGDQFERAVEAALEVAGVVRPAERGPVRELADQVAAAQLDRVESELTRGGVERGLDQVARLGAAGTAVGAVGTLFVRAPVTITSTVWTS